MVVAFTTVKKEAAMPPKLTAVVPIKFVPVIVTVAPVVAVVGVNDVMMGVGSVYIQTAPIELSSVPPTIVVVPSAERATEEPCLAAPIEPVPISLLPCWLQILLSL